MFTAEEYIGGNISTTVVAWSLVISKTMPRVTVSVFTAAFESLFIGVTCFVIFSAVFPTSSDYTGATAWAFQLQFLFLVANVALQSIFLGIQKTENLDLSNLPHGLVQATSNAYCGSVFTILTCYLCLFFQVRAFYFFEIVCK